MNTTEQIKSNAVYKQVLADSFGGVMYNVANRGKYDTTTIMGLWNNMTPVDRNSVDGIMRGAFSFLREDKE